MQNRAVTISADIVQQIAKEADTDPRSVWKRLAGGTVRGRAGARIDRAIAALRSTVSQESHAA